MEKHTSPVTTIKGLQLQAKTHLGVHGVKFTRLGVGTGNRNIDYNNRAELEQIESMFDERQSVDIASIKIINKTAVRVRGVLTNQGLDAGYHISEIGLYAFDPDEGEILYSIVLFVRQDYFPSFDGFSTSSVTLTYYTAVGNTANLNISISPDAVASAADVQDLLNEFQKAGQLADAIAQIKSEIETGIGGKRVINTRIRDSLKPTYGVGDGNESVAASVVLTALPYTEAAEVTIDVDGTPYTVNMSADSVNAPEGTIIIKKLEE